MKLSSRCFAARELPEEESTQNETTAANSALLERLRPPDPQLGEGGDDDEVLEAPPSSRPPPHPSDQRVGLGAPDAPQSLLEENWRPRIQEEIRISFLAFSPHDLTICILTTLAIVNMLYWATALSISLPAT